MSSISGINSYSVMESNIKSSASNSSTGTQAKESMGILDSHIKTKDSARTDPSYIVRISAGNLPADERSSGALDDRINSMKESGEEFRKQQANSKPKGLVENVVDLMIMAGIM